MGHEVHAHCPFARLDGTKDEITRAYADWADEVRAVIEATPPGDILAVPSRDRTFLERWEKAPSPSSATPRTPC